MATHRVSVLGHSTIPDTSGNVYPDTYSSEGVNDFFRHLCFTFLQGTTKDSLYGSFSVPENFDSAASLVIIWTAHDLTQNDVVWDFEYRCVGGDDAESLDEEDEQESDLTVTDAGPSAVHERMVATIPLTSANFSAGDTVEFIFSRDGTPGTDDDLANPAILFDLLFEFDDA